MTERMFTEVIETKKNVPEMRITKTNALFPGRTRNVLKQVENSKLPLNFWSREPMACA